MLHNFFVIALRNFSRNRIFSLINIFGLAIGMVSCLLITLWIKDELSYDKGFSNYDKVYGVNIKGNWGDGDFETSNTPPPVGASLVSEFSEVATYTRTFPMRDQILRSENGNKVKYFTESKIFAVDSNFLQVFNYPIVSGNVKECLTEPFSVVLTERIAQKYFGAESAMGKVLLMGNDKTPYKVTGILKDIPFQSSIQFEILASVSSVRAVKNFNWSWVWLQMNNYVILRDDVNNNPAKLAALHAKFPALVMKHASSGFKRIGQPLDELYKKGGKWELSLQPLQEVHLNSSKIGGRYTNLGNIQYIYIFSGIAAIILILACVNFMNLSTARSVKRSREVGIRKVLGSLRSQLIAQFLSEAVLYSLSAFAIALLAIDLLLPSFNQMSGKELEFNLFSDPIPGLLLFGLSIATGLLAGLYPAFYLTSFEAVDVLKGSGQKNSNKGGQGVRNKLVIFQFAVSACLIICTAIVFAQLEYLRNKNLGFDKENVVVINSANRLGASKETFIKEIQKLKGVELASASTGIPGKGNFEDLYVPEGSGQQPGIAKDISLASYTVDYDFQKTLGIKLKEGRYFSNEFGSDSASVVLNETAVSKIGWKEPIGKYIKYPGNGDQQFKVVGVIKDFNEQALNNPINAFALFHSSSHTYDISDAFVVVRITPGNPSEIVKDLSTTWAGFAPSNPFDFVFLDQELDAQYRLEERQGKVFGTFTILSIFVACLGLFGLVAYATEQRTKEIGIRKVMGASEIQIFTLLSVDFLKLVLIGFLLAAPVAWYAMDKWLQDFAFKITMNGWVFAGAGLALAFMALITISLQSFKASRSNPIESLRNE